MEMRPHVRAVAPQVIRRVPGVLGTAAEAAAGKCGVDVGRKVRFFRDHPKPVELLVPILRNGVLRMRLGVNELD
jgi:hypothetical protein